MGTIAAQSTSAEVVAINRGTFVFEAGNGSVDIFGNRGFNLSAAGSIDGGRFTAYTKCQALTPECAPGTRVELDAFWRGNDLQGTATYRGVTYQNVGALDGDSSAEIGFTGSVVMPEMRDAPIQIQVPSTSPGPSRTA